MSPHLQLTFWAAVLAPMKLGMRWWTGLGNCAIFRASIKSHTRFLMAHFHAFGSSPSVTDFSAIDSRAAASSLRRSASYAASLNAASFWRAAVMWWFLRDNRTKRGILVWKIEGKFRGFVDHLIGNGYEWESLSSWAWASIKMAVVILSITCGKLCWMKSRFCHE